MIQGKSVMAIIPARGGSKRIPGKNLRDIAGKPMIQWTIDAAKGSQYLDTIAVSTEDPAIVKHCSGQGLQIVDRPAHLASDTANIYDALFHAIDSLPPHDYVCLLQVTSPLRIADDIDRCLEVVSACHAPSCISIDNSRPVANGAVYVAWASWLREFKNFDLGRTVVSEMPISRGIDVDTHDDFQEAERLLIVRQKLGMAA